MRKLLLFLSVVSLLIPAYSSKAQEQQGILQGGTLTGNLLVYSQYYQKDEDIEAQQPLEKFGFNGYFQMNYEWKDLLVGVRFESYLPAMLGYPTNLKGKGVPYRFARYKMKNFEVTAGNFYEQFGNGMIFRAQENRQLGIDNSVDGLKLKYFLSDKARITGILGKQRDAFTESEGIVRGLDTDIYIDRFFVKEDQQRTSPLSATLGLSYVSKFQGYDGSEEYIPLNVDAYAARLQVQKGVFGFTTEYVTKASDPSRVNSKSVRKGQTLMTGVSFTAGSLGVNLTGRFVDNMDYRSDRDAIDNRLMVNFITANTRQHTYRLLTLYPYATQVLGEIGYQGDIYYNLKKGSTLGGKYGTTLALNFSQMHSLDTMGTMPAVGDRKYFQDINFEVSRKWSPKFRTNFLYAYIEYDKDKIEGRSGYGIVKSHTVVLEAAYKYSKKSSIRTEIQHLATLQDHGSWAMLLLELNVKNHWFFFASDELNYNGISVGVPVHYYNFGSAYVQGATRFSLSYGRQRAGLLCVGGICRIVPASTGLSFTVSSSF